MDIEEEGGKFFIYFKYDKDNGGEILNADDIFKSQFDNFTQYWKEEISKDQIFGNEAVLEDDKIKTKAFNYLFKLYTTCSQRNNYDRIKNIKDDVTYFLNTGKNVNLVKMQELFKWAGNNSPYAWLYRDKTFR